MSKEESAWSRKNFRGIAGILALIGFFLTFAGIAVLGFTLFQVTSFASWSSFSWMSGGSDIDFMTLSMSFMATPMIKTIGLFLGFIGMAMVNANHKASGALLVIAGVITIPPIVIGGTQVLELVLQNSGWLPFVPHFISGSLFLAAGALVFTSLPPERPRHTISASIDERPIPEPTVCPNCRTPLIGDEKYCPGCGKPIRHR
ncbi:MAG: hypothetical protein ACFFCO_13105 [Promethearchaeota archaeon]